MNACGSLMCNISAPFRKLVRKSKIFMGSFSSNKWFFRVRFEFLRWTLTLELSRDDRVSALTINLYDLYDISLPNVFSSILWSVNLYVGVQQDVSEMVQFWTRQSWPQHRLHNCVHGNLLQTMSLVVNRYVCLLWFGKLGVDWSKCIMRQSRSYVVGEEGKFRVQWLSFEISLISLLVLLRCPFSPLGRHDVLFEIIGVLEGEFLGSILVRHL